MLSVMFGKQLQFVISNFKLHHLVQNVWLTHQPKINEIRKFRQCYDHPKFVKQLNLSW